MGNIFQEALNILQSKQPAEMTDDETKTVQVASIPLNVLSQFNDMTPEQGLKLLAYLIDLRDEVHQVLESFLQGAYTTDKVQWAGECDFRCAKTGEPLLSFSNKNGHRWVCHMSCLQEQMDAYTMLRDLNETLSQSEQ